MRLICMYFEEKAYHEKEADTSQHQITRIWVEWLRIRPKTELSLCFGGTLN